MDIENPGSKAPFLCYKALGFEKKGAGNPWTKFEDSMKIWGAYVRIKSLMKADPKKWGSKSRAVKIVSEENNIGKEKINKWYKKFEKSLL